MELAQKLDDYGKPAWIAVMVVSFIVFWPIGLAVLAYMIWSGRMGCSKRGGPGRWYNKTESGKASRSEWWSRTKAGHQTGNRAFDEYREETLHRLEQEHDEFMGFLDNLRQARDKAEFDQFMDERRQRSEEEAPESSDGPAAQPQS